MKRFLRTAVGEPLFVIEETENPDYPLEITPAASSVPMSVNEARRFAALLVEAVNHAERHDPELSWQPWSVNRGKADPRL